MEKPISLLINDMKKELTDVINKYQLPMCIVSPILQNLTAEVMNAEKQEYITSKNEYDKANAEANDANADANKETLNTKDKS